LKALKDPKKFFNLIKFNDFYCGDDWNYWWMHEFENYSLLPKSVGKSLEVGSGPYSNSRLISKVVNIGEIHCTDPLMEVYKKFKKTWISEMSRLGKISVSKGKAEIIEYPDNFFDLSICINVLDHVEDADRCLNELVRVLKPGGYLIFGQELVDEEDMTKGNVIHDVGHPIKINQKYLDEKILPIFSVRLQKILFRQEGRASSHRGGTYLYIGIKK
jgi:ubiquinone/menaquinone biosynthesis C-methylase UbiE